LKQFVPHSNKLLYNHLIHLQRSELSKRGNKQRRCGLCDKNVRQYLDFHSERCIDIDTGHCRRCGQVLEVALIKQDRRGKQLADHENRCRNSKDKIVCGECEEPFVYPTNVDARNARRAHMEQKHGYKYCNDCYIPNFDKDVCYATKENYIHHRALYHNKTTLKCHCEMVCTCTAK